jgi:DNA invertase Pin-like site-specific DNA recombinase
MVLTVMVALAQMELEIKRERITDSVSKRRVAGKDVGCRRQAFTDTQVKNAARLIDVGESAAQVARDMARRGDHIPTTSRHSQSRPGGRDHGLRWLLGCRNKPLPGTLCPRVC